MVWDINNNNNNNNNNSQKRAHYSVMHLYLYNPGQNVLGHLRKLGTKTHFAKLTHILPLKKAWGCCYKGLFLLSPYPPNSVDCVELRLECITSTLHRGERGNGRCLNLTSYCVSVPRVLTRVVACKLRFWTPFLADNSALEIIGIFFYHNVYLHCDYSSAIGGQLKVRLKKVPSLPAVLHSSCSSK